MNLDAKIAALQTLRASYVAAVTVGAFGQPGDGSSFTMPMANAVPAGVPMELPRGALMGKSLPAAIRLYLSAVKQKQTIREIATALKEGGVESTAKNFETPVSSAINRLKVSGEVLRFKDGWALAEFYPETLRAKLGAASEPKPRKKAGRKAAKNGSKPQKPTKKAGGKSKPEIITAFLAKNADMSFTASELATGAGIKAVGLGIVLMHLTKAGKIIKTPDGLYRAV